MLLVKLIETPEGLKLDTDLPTYIGGVQTDISDRCFKDMNEIYNTVAMDEDYKLLISFK